LPDILQNVFKKVSIFQKLNHPGMSPAALDGTFIDSIDVSKINPHNVRHLSDPETAQISIAISD
jgi:hypothetical protein